MYLHDMVLNYAIEIYFYCLTKLLDPTQSTECMLDDVRVHTSQILVIILMLQKIGSYKLLSSIGCKKSMLNFMKISLSFYNFGICR